MSTTASQYGSLDLHENNSDDDIADIDEESEASMTQSNRYQRLQRRHPSSTIVGKIMSSVLLPILALSCGMSPFLVSFPPAGMSNMSVVRGSSISDLEVGNVVVSSTTQRQSKTSLFFEHVLEWIEIPLSEAPSNFDDNGNNESNHYRASIEFCSDPGKGLYGYGPVGNCVPGKPAPLIRIKPKQFYHLTLFNNAHIDTNIHTHGLHVSGVGTVDDVTRVAKPGECLTYDVSTMRVGFGNVQLIS